MIRKRPLTLIPDRAPRAELAGEPLPPADDGEEEDREVWTPPPPRQRRLITSADRWVLEVDA